MRHYSPKAHISSARGFRAQAAQAAALALILFPAVLAATINTFFPDCQSLRPDQKK